MRKINIIAASVIAMLLLACHCPSAALGEQPSRLQQTVELDGAKLIVDAKLLTDVPVEGAVLLCKDYDWSDIDLPGILFEGRAYTSETFFGDGRDNLLLKDELGNELRPSLESGSFHYYSINSDGPNNGSQLIRAARHGMGPYEVKRSLPGFAPEMSLDMVKQKLDAIGLPMGYERADIEGFTAEEMRAAFVSEVESLKSGEKERNPEYTERITALSKGELKDCYRITIPFVFQGIELYPDLLQLSSVEYYGHGGPMFALVTQDGIQMLDTQGHAFMVEREMESAPFISAEQALERLAEHLTMMVWPEDIELDKVNLFYAPLAVPGEPQKTQLVPAWCFAYKGTDQWEFVINAQTGEWIR